VAFREVAAYCATKTALLHSPKSGRRIGAGWHLSKRNSSGIFPTEMTNGIVLGTPRGQELLTRTPMRRFGHPEELVGAAVLLASDAASFITANVSPSMEAS